MQCKTIAFYHKQIKCKCEGEAVDDFDDCKREDCLLKFLYIIPSRKEPITIYRNLCFYFHHGTDDDKDSINSLLSLTRRYDRHGDEILPRLKNEVNIKMRVRADG